VHFLQNADSLSVSQATADRATVVNLSNHVYFNLGGHGSGWDEMKRHVLTVPHNQFTPDDSDYLPTGIVQYLIINRSVTLFYRGLQRDVVYLG
jgi:galactose mutarotase-like enzyme